MIGKAKRKRIEAFIDGLEDGDEASPDMVWGFLAGYCCRNVELAASTGAYKGEQEHSLAKLEVAIKHLLETTEPGTMASGTGMAVWMRRRITLASYTIKKMREAAATRRARRK